MGYGPSFGKSLLLISENLSPSLIEWAHLQNFKFDIMYGEGNRMTHVDLFSRNHVESRGKIINESSEKEINFMKY